MTQPASDAPEPAGFLDVPTLLETSLPQGQTPWAWYAMGMFLLMLVSSEVMAGQSVQLQAAFRAFSFLTMLLLLLSVPALTVMTVNRVRAEQHRLDRAAELIQLRRWPEAGLLLQQVLLTPARSEEYRAQALVLLTTVLGRYERYEDALQVYERLIEEDVVDPASAYAIRLGRAMALLHEDRLFDADRAIAELRRVPNSNQSAGLALVELYRDVKTGHPAEAIELFESRLPHLRAQLGHRVGDAWALVARAYDLLGRAEEARQAVINATLLSPASELLRRYPEVRKLVGRYDPAPTPQN